MKCTSIFLFRSWACRVQFVMQGKLSFEKLQHNLTAFVFKWKATSTSTNLWYINIVCVLLPFPSERLFFWGKYRLCLRKYIPRSFYNANLGTSRSVLRKNSNHINDFNSIYLNNYLQVNALILWIGFATFQKIL